MRTIKMYFICLCIYLTSLNFATSLSSDGGDASWSHAKRNSISKLSNSNSLLEKRVSQMGHKGTDGMVVRKWKRLSTKSENQGYRHLDGASNNEHFIARQNGGGWGWGWPSSHGGGSYDVYTIIAVAAFAALFGALMYELMGGSSRRSLDSSLNLPAVSLGLDSDKLPEVMVKFGDWIANSSWLDNMGNSSKAIREISDKVGVKKWFEAFKKDPVEYQCIRKIACETLASSTLAKKSLQSKIGGVFLSVFGSFIENGDQLQGLVKDVVENPKMCEDLVEGGFCDENT